MLSALVTSLSTGSLALGVGFAKGSPEVFGQLELLTFAGNCSMCMLLTVKELNKCMAPRKIYKKRDHSQLVRLQPHVLCQRCWRHCCVAHSPRLNESLSLAPGSSTEGLAESDSSTSFTSLQRRQ